MFSMLIFFPFVISTGGRNLASEIKIYRFTRNDNCLLIKMTELVEVYV